MLVALVSAKGSPGVTTSAIALASCWPGPAMVIDADPFGGDVRAGLGAGVWPVGIGLTDLVVDARDRFTEELLVAHAHRPAQHCPPVVAGLGCVGQSGGVPWSRLGPQLAALRGGDVIADCGRFAPSDGIVPLLHAADVVVLVTGSSLRAARAAARVAPLIEDALGTGHAVALLVAGPRRPYSSDEIAASCGLSTAWDIAHDPRAAAVWSDGATPGRWHARSALQRDAERVATAVCDLAAHGRGAA